MTIPAAPETDGDVEDLVDRLLDMDDDDFYAVVKEDRRLRKMRDAELPPILEALRHDDTLDRWLETVARADADILLSIEAERNIKR